MIKSVPDWAETRRKLGGNSKQSFLTPHGRLVGQLLSSPTASRLRIFLFFSFSMGSVAIKSPAVDRNLGAHLVAQTRRRIRIRAN
jgi:hypothetical protein